LGLNRAKRKRGKGEKEIAALCWQWLNHEDTKAGRNTKEKIAGLRLQLDLATNAHELTRMIAGLCWQWLNHEDTKAGRNTKEKIAGLRLQLDLAANGHG
jgi:hypothetical protein